MIMKYLWSCFFSGCSFLKFSQTKCLYVICQWWVLKSHCRIRHYYRYLVLIWKLRLRRQSYFNYYFYYVLIKREQHMNTEKETNKHCTLFNCFTQKLKFELQMMTVKWFISLLVRVMLDANVVSIQNMVPERISSLLWRYK